MVTVSYFDVRNDPDLASGGPFKLSCVFLTCHYHSLSISFFLVQQSVSGSSGVFSTTALESVVLQGVLIPFIYEKYLESRIWGLGMLIATGVPLHLGLFMKQLDNTCIYLGKYRLRDIFLYLAV